MKLRAAIPVLALVLAGATGASAQSGGHLLLESRLRYETVEQAGIARAAEALSDRTRIGWETGETNGLRGLIELENVEPLSAERYNVATPTRSLNGRTQYPAINDPENTEINRAQLTWKVSPALTVVAGRQLMNVDDQRFVGTSAWRQDEQTFDGVKADLTLGKFGATYIYLTGVNRNLDQDWTSDSHGLILSYAASDLLKIEAFGYALDFNNTPILSNQTVGARASGRFKLDRVQLGYALAHAHQSDYRGNSAPFSLDYDAASVDAASGIWAGRISYEVLGGDGTRGFITPLQSSHGMQGWADAFSAMGGAKTFVDGLQDLNFQVVSRPKWKFGTFGNPQFTLRQHDFRNPRFDAALARETDAEATLALTPKLSLTTQYADFQAASHRPVGAAAVPASRTKLTVGLEFKL